MKRFTSSQNEIQIRGWIGKDSVYCVSQGGVPVCKFDVGTNRFVKAKDGTKTTQTIWHHVVCFYTLADHVKNKLFAGDMVVVRGEQINRYHNDKFWSEIFAEKIDYQTEIVEGTNEPPVYDLDR